MKKPILLIFLNLLLFPGTEFSLLIKSRTDSIMSKVKVKCYSQSQYLRINFISTQFKAETEIEKNKKEFFKKGIYWLYNKNTNKFFIVNPKEKRYFEFPDSSFFSNLFISDNIKEIKNVKVQIKNLGKENIERFECEHIYIKYSYESYLKFNTIIETVYVDETRDIWITKNIIFDEIPLNFKSILFLSGIKEIDSNIIEKISFKPSTFPIKLLISKKIKKDIENDEYFNEIKIANISSYNILENVFIIPKDYRKINLVINR